LRKVHGSLGQGESIGVPVEQRRSLAERLDQWIGLAVGGRSNLLPAELDRQAEDVLSAVSARDQLCTETDAEHGLVGFTELPCQCSDLREIGMVGVIERALGTAENDQPGITVGASWDGIAEERAAHLG